MGVDALYPQQADGLDDKRRAAVLDRMQRLVYEKSICAPIWELSLINGVGPRVGQSAMAPFEDITIKST